MAFIGQAHLKRVSRYGGDDGSGGLTAKTQFSSQSKPSESKIAKSNFPQQFTKSNVTSDFIERRNVIEPLPRTASKLTIDVDVINYESDPTFPSSARRSTPNGDNKYNQKPPRPVLPPKSSPTGASSQSLTKPNNPVEAGSGWIAVKGVNSSRPCTGTRISNSSSTNSSAKFLPASRVSNHSSSSLNSHFNASSAFRKSSSSSLLDISLNVQRISSTTTNQRSSNSSSHTEVIKNAASSEQNNDCESEIRENRVCGNPLCRRKWKRLNCKYLPTLCPTCRKGLEALAVASTTSSDEVPSVIPAYSAIEADQNDTGKGGLTNESDPKTLQALKTIWTALLHNIIDATHIPVLPPASQIQSKTSGKAAAVSKVSKQSDSDKGLISECLTVRGANNKSSTSAVNNVHSSPFTSSSSSPPLSPSASAPAISIEQITAEMEATLPAPPEDSDVRNWNSCMSKISRKSFMSGLLIRRKPALWELILHPETLSEELSSMLVTTSTQPSLSDINKSVSDQNVQPAFSNAMLSALNTLAALRPAPGQKTPPPSPTLRREIAKSTLYHGLILQASKKVLNENNPDNTYNEANKNNFRIFAVDWTPEDPNTPPPSLQLVKCLLLLNPSYSERPHLPYIIKVTDRGDPSNLGDLCRWFSDIIPEEHLSSEQQNQLRSLKNKTDSCDLDMLTSLFCPAQPHTVTRNTADSNHNTPSAPSTPPPVSLNRCTDSNNPPTTTNSRATPQSTVPILRENLSNPVADSAAASPQTTGTVNNNNNSNMSNMPSFFSFDPSLPPLMPPVTDYSAAAAAASLYNWMSLSHHVALLNHQKAMSESSSSSSSMRKPGSHSSSSPSNASSHANSSIFAALNKAINLNNMSHQSEGNAMGVSLPPTTFPFYPPPFFPPPNTMNANIPNMMMNENIPSLPSDFHHPMAAFHNWVSSPSVFPYPHPSSFDLLSSPPLFDTSVSSRAAADVATSSSDSGFTNNSVPPTVNKDNLSSSSQSNFITQQQLNSFGAGIPVAHPSLLNPWLAQPHANPLFQMLMAATVGGPASSSSSSSSSNSSNVSQNVKVDQMKAETPAVSSASNSDSAVDSSPNPLQKKQQENKKPINDGAQKDANARGRVAGSTTSSRSRCCRSHSPQAQCGGRIWLRDIYKNSNAKLQAAQASSGSTTCDHQVCGLLSRRSVSTQSDLKTNSHADEEIAYDS